MHPMHQMALLGIIAQNTQINLRQFHAREHFMLCSMWNIRLLSKTNSITSPTDMEGNHIGTLGQYVKESKLCLSMHVYSCRKSAKHSMMPILHTKNALFIYNCGSAVIAHQNNYSDVNKRRRIFNLAVRQFKEISQID